MTQCKYNRAAKAAHCRKYGDTYSAIIKTMSEHTDLNNLTSRQIAQIADAMYMSYQAGYGSGIRA